jgi:ABC-type transport system substrate-binding protein
MALALQIHATLFKMDSTNSPKLHLINYFTVSKDGLVYKFTLKDVLFHDKTKLSSEIILNCIEYYIYNKIINYEQLFSIDGVQEFSDGKASKISGIILEKKDPLTFSIILKYPDINFLQKLTDQRLSILKPNRDPKIGLGEYKIEKITEKEVSLSRFENANLNFNKSPDKSLYYLNVSKENAIKGFIDGKYDDLFFYELTDEDKERIKQYSQSKNLISLRVYVLVLNAKSRLKYKKERIELFSAIDWDKLREDCYPGNKRAYSLMPKGFLGYKNKPDILTESYFKKIYAKNFHSEKPQKYLAKKNYKILISEHLGSEECVKNSFQNVGKKYSNWDVNIIPHLRLLESWQKNQVDAIFIWIQGMSHLDFWGFFNPKSTFLFGDPRDNNFLNIYEKFDHADNLEDKEKFARELDSHIVNLATVFPVYHPSVSVIYANRFQPLQFGLHFPYSIPLSSFNLKKE